MAAWGSRLLAEFVVERCGELQDWIERYNCALDHIIDDHTDRF